MTDQHAFIHVKSSKFPVLPGEDEELINEGTYGQALSQYLEAELKTRGYDVPFICCEDWGWWVEIAGNPFATGVRVFATESLPETEELCVIAAPAPGRKWSWSRFRFVETTAVVTRLQADLIEIFDTDPDVEILAQTEEYPLD